MPHTYTQCMIKLQSRQSLISTTVTQIQRCFLKNLHTEVNWWLSKILLNSESIQTHTYVNLNDHRLTMPANRNRMFDGYIRHPISMAFLPVQGHLLSVCLRVWGTPWNYSRTLWGYRLYIWVQYHQHHHHRHRFHHHHHQHLLPDETAASFAAIATNTHATIIQIYVFMV